MTIFGRCNPKLGSKAYGFCLPKVMGYELLRTYGLWVANPCPPTWCSVDLTPLTWSTNRVKSIGQSIIDRSVNKGQRGQSHVAHAILFKLIRLCTWASKCTCNMKILQRKFYWLAFSCSRLNMPPKSLLWEHFYTNRSRFKDCWKVYWTLFQAEI